jgi:DNA polymerase
MALYQADPEKADLYKDFAAALYGIDKADVSKNQRQVGKVAHLGLGFGAGAATFQKVAKLMGGVDLSLDESRDVVNKWRRMYGEIATGWKTCHAALKKIYMDAEEAIDPWGMCWTTKEGIRTPKGIIRYPFLREETTEDGKTEWCYGEGRNKARIYAGKIDENLVQHLARCVIADNSLAVQKELGLNPALMVHDELVYVVPEEDAEHVLDTVQRIMRTPPTWWPELVTWSEGDIADTYGAAK